MVSGRELQFADPISTSRLAITLLLGGFICIDTLYERLQDIAELVELQIAIVRDS